MKTKKGIVLCFLMTILLGVLMFFGFNNLESYDTATPIYQVYLDGEKVDTGKTLKKHLSDNGYINVNYCDYYTPTDTIREFFGYRKQFESPSNVVIIPDQNNKRKSKPSKIGGLRTKN